MRNRILWTVLCSIVASVMFTIGFKEMGVDDLGWSGGLGAGVGVLLGTLLDARFSKSSEDKGEAD